MFLSVHSQRITNIYHRRILTFFLEIFMLIIINLIVARFYQVEKLVGSITKEQKNLSQHCLTRFVQLYGREHIQIYSIIISAFTFEWHGFYFISLMRFSVFYTRVKIWHLPKTQRYCYARYTDTYGSFSQTHLLKIILRKQASLALEWA